MITFSYKSYPDCFVCQRFDHSDSRHARVRTMTVHMYNNYYQHCDVYGIGATSGSNIFMESNYYPGFIRVGCCENNGCGMNYGLIYFTKRTKPDIFWFLVRFLFSFGNFLSCTFDCI